MRIGATAALLATSLVQQRCLPARLCAVEPPPRDLDLVCDEARTCLRSALLEGK